MRELILEYQFTLEVVLKDKPHLRQYLTCCKHCQISFICDPRNIGRNDLGCPFGCQEAYRKKRSTERSTAYNRTNAGKQKKKALNNQRGKSRAADGYGKGSDNPPELGHVRMQTETTPANHLPEPSKVADPSPRSPQSPPKQSPNFNCTTEQKSGGRFVRADEPTTMDRQTSKLLNPLLGESGQTGNDSGRDPHALGPSPDSNSHAFNAGIVEYVRAVTSLIEGRRVSREEVLQMLNRTMRQHRLSRERRIDYRMRALREKPP